MFYFECKSLERKPYQSKHTRALTPGATTAKKARNDHNGADGDNDVETNVHAFWRRYIHVIFRQYLCHFLLEFIIDAQPYTGGDQCQTRQLQCL